MTWCSAEAAEKRNKQIKETCITGFNKLKQAIAWGDKPTWTLVRPQKGGQPLRSSKRMAPILHISTWSKSFSLNSSFLSVSFLFRYFVYIPLVSRPALPPQPRPGNWSLAKTFGKCKSHSRFDYALAQESRTFSSYFWNRRTSGAMYNGDPHTVSAE